MKNFINTTEQGLKVLTVPLKTPSVTIMVLVKTGSRNEIDSQAGLAHFVEHMFFKGTKNMPSSKDIGLAIENIGGTSNAFTSYEYTGYYIKIPKINYNKAIEILGDMLINSIYSPEEIVKESGVIVEEINMYEDMPMHKVQRIFQEKLFKDNALGRDIAGSIKTVKSFKKKHFVDFRNKYYQAKNLLVVVAGDVDKKNVIDKINSSFVFLNDQFEESKLSAKKSSLNNVLEVISDKNIQSHIVLGGFANKKMHADRYALRVTSTILSGGFGSLLFQEIREKLGLAYYVRFSFSSFSDIGKYSLSMGVDTERYEQAISGVIDVLNRIKKGDFSDIDINRSKNYLLGHYTTGLEASDDIALFYGLQKLLTNEIESIGKISKEILSVTKDDIIKSFSKIFVKNNIFGVMLGDVERKSGLEFRI